jgi:cytochrome c553
MERTPLNTKGEIMRHLFVMTVLTATLSATAWAGDPVAGQTKANGCMICHGTTGFPGIFYTLQLAGRNADKLVIKTNKYRSGKILHPVMNMAVMSLSDKDVEDISAYYQSLGKPILITPYVQIKGDDDEPAAPAQTPQAQ